MLSCLVLLSGTALVPAGAAVSCRATAGTTGAVLDSRTIHLAQTVSWSVPIITRHSLFEPISVRCGLGKPASCLTSLGESNSLCSLPGCTQLPQGPSHALPHLIAAAQPKLITLQQCGNKVLIIDATKIHVPKF